MNLLGRGLIRVGLILFRMVIRPVELVSPRWYMKAYISVLKRAGLRTNGDPRYISSSAAFDDFSLITLSERVVVARNVIFLTHDYSVTTGLIAIGDTPRADISVCREIKVGHNVFIGISALILPGVSIGDNVIIGAGSVVAKDVPSDTVYVGNPGRVVGTVRSRADHWRSIATAEFAHVDRR